MFIQQQGCLDVFPTRLPFSEHDLKPLPLDQELPDFRTFWSLSPPEILEDSDSVVSISHLEDLLSQDGFIELDRFDPKFGIYQP